MKGSLSIKVINARQRILILLAFWLHFLFMVGGKLSRVTREKVCILSVRRIDPFTLREKEESRNGIARQSLFVNLRPFSYSFKQRVTVGTFKTRESFALTSLSSLWKKNRGRDKA